MYSLCKFIYENIRVKSKYCTYKEIIYKKLYFRTNNSLSAVYVINEEIKG